VWSFGFAEWAYTRRIAWEQAVTLSTLTGIARDDYAGLVKALGVPYRRAEAYRRLLSAGERAVDAVQDGLHDESPEVITGCLRILDHHLREDAIPALLENMRHPHPSVRAWALHALACDRCKEGACRPGEDDAIPMAIDMLENDPSHAVRTMAADMLGPSAVRNEAVVAALVAAAANDPHPNVRKKANWYVPGGPIYKRLERKARQQDRKRQKTE
jgi:hypothetical protein